MRQGKFFLIRSQMNMLVLGVQSSDPGCVVRTEQPDVTRDAHNYGQLFYDDFKTGTIRSMLNDYCLDVSDNLLVLNPYHERCPSQQWIVNEKTIKNVLYNHHVIDIAHSNRLPGAHVITCNYKGEESQQWYLHYVEPKYFRLRNSRYVNLVCACSSDDRDASISCLTDKSTTSSHHVWFEDKFGVIRSKINEHAIDVNGNKIRLKPYDARNVYQQWTISGNTICNKHISKKVLSAFPSDNNSDVWLAMRTYDGSDTQLWSIEYI